MSLELVAIYFFDKELALDQNNTKKNKVETTALEYFGTLFCCKTSPFQRS